MRVILLLLCVFVHDAGQKVTPICVHWMNEFHGSSPSLFCGCALSVRRTLTPGHDAVQKVTLIPRGQARGLTWFIPNDDPTLISKQQIFARIVGGLGGRAAEEVVFGENEITTGAMGDLVQISGMAKQVRTSSPAWPSRGALNGLFRNEVTSDK